MIGIEAKQSKTSSTVMPVLSAIFSAVTGGSTGLMIVMTDLVQDGLGNILSLSVQESLIPSLPGPDVMLRLSVDEFLQSVDASFSLDGGATVQSPFLSLSYTPTSAQTTLSSLQFVPEPGTGLLVMLGLGAMGMRRRAGRLEGLPA